MKVKLRPRFIVMEWLPMPDVDPKQDGWLCPKCGNIVWLDAGFSPDDYDMHYCTCCGQPLMEHGGVFKG